MASAKADAVRRHIHQLVRKHNDSQASDRELLERFTFQEDEAAFEVLFRRHAAMVLAVGTRVLGNAHDAEDVCQAAFLLLAKKAPSQHWQTSVANWLHKTAHFVALKARTAAYRRARREGRVSPRSPTNPLAEITGQELLAVLDQELLALPEPLRAPLVLCYLQGATRDEAAQRLGWPLATLKNRLERGRTRLHAALVRRGLGLSVVLLGTLSTQETANATAQIALAPTTVRAALALATGKAVEGVIASEVSQLLEGGLGIMGWNHFKAGFAMLLVGGLLSVAGTLAVCARADREVRTPPKQAVASRFENAKQADAGTTLRYQFKAGDKFSYVVERKMDTQATSPALARTVSTTETYDVTWRVVRVDPDGTASLKLTIDRLHYVSHDGFPASKFEFDSRIHKNPVGAPGMIRALSACLKAQVKAEFTCTMSPRGEISDFKFPTRLAEVLKNMKGLYGQRLSEGLQRDLTSQGSVILPKSSTAKGNNWEEKTFLPVAGIGATITVYTEATYQGLSDHGGKQLEAITLRPTARSIEGPANIGPFTLKDQEGKGSILFDNKVGRLVETSVAQDVDVETGLPGQTVAWKMKFSLSTKLVAGK